MFLDEQNDVYHTRSKCSIVLRIGSSCDIIKQPTLTMVKVFVLKQSMGMERLLFHLIILSTQYMKHLNMMQKVKKNKQNNF